jgi:hypothetical protein
VANAGGTSVTGFSERHWTPRFGRSGCFGARGRAEGRRTHPVRLERGELFRARGGERDADLLVSARRKGLGFRVRTEPGRGPMSGRGLSETRKNAALRCVWSRNAVPRVVSSDEARRVADRNAPRGEPVGDGEAQRVVLGAACGRRERGGDTQGVSGGEIGVASRAGGRADASRASKKGVTRPRKSVNTRFPRSPSPLYEQ